MKRPIEVQTAAVWRGEERVGILSRTQQGSVFEYAEAFYLQHSAEPGGICAHLPYAARRKETFGSNLHSYFAGLLPEGMRLKALVQGTKTSEDDLLTLLIAAGPDTVGDLAVVPDGEEPDGEKPSVERLEFSSALFQDLFEQSLRRTRERRGDPVVPGVQEKVSASILSFPLKPLGRTACILKLNPSGKPGLIENEAFFMKMAAACGLETARSSLVKDREGNSGLLVERFDRRWAKQRKQLVRIHQEDACQLLDRYPADKYRLKCSEIAEALQEVCGAPIPELARFLRLVAFSYLIGNGDLHGKNISVVATGPEGSLRFSPAYDVLSTLPYGDRRMALKLDGRDDNLKRAHFLEFGQRYGVNARTITRMLNELCDELSGWAKRVEEIGLDPRKTADLERVMTKRREHLG